MLSKISSAINLLENLNTIHILENNQDKINWCLLSKNSNSNAILLLEKNLDKIFWCSLSENPNDIHLLEIKIK